MQEEGIYPGVVNSSIERLQGILELEQKHAIPIDDIKEIAYDLISFYELLAEDSNA